MKISKAIFTIGMAMGTALAAPCAELMVECEAFAEKGGWVVDQQFVDQMGSPYLMAHGLGKPVEDASTTIDIPEDGTYSVWTRTYNWTSPWDQAEGPGRFEVKIGTRRLPQTLGCKGDCWEWQKAGEAKLKAGETKIALHDLTGFNGRCDAIYLTTEGKAPAESGMELAVMRRQLNSWPDCPAASEKHYDLVVIGGGIAGMCAAISAARLGCDVALVNDRPVLGGNNSAEVRVHLGGHIGLGPNEGLGRLIREFGHSRPGNAQPAEVYEDNRKDSIIMAEERIDLYPSFRAITLEKEGNRIKAVTIKHIEDGREISLYGDQFADCTGDGTIGYLAGADYLMGREARAEYGESLAPEKADSLVMGASVQWYSKDLGKKAKFPRFKYGMEFNEGNCERVTMGEWKWETGMNFNQIEDGELIRDYGLLVIFNNWSFLKNDLKDNDRWANRELDWAAYIAGRRESRRLLGDYVLKQDDIDKNMRHEDASFTASWAIDLHFPDSLNSANWPGQEFKAATKHRWIYPCAVPYRCLYSRNVDNLFMAGRDISVTHVALGTVRVMRTTGMMGEVVGMAASLCKKHGETPRGVYQNRLAELKDLMAEGVGRKDAPDNQGFNCANRLLERPRIFYKSDAEAYDY
ncbi:MAG: FAD-dependent oxidoreductase [Clostridium sp.]|nr:FAD-dependent oxidoreductase [Clostridium sp.]